MTNRSPLRTLPTLVVACAMAGSTFLTGCAGVPSTSTPTSLPTPIVEASAVDVPLVPPSGNYLGVYYGDGSISDTDSAIGRTPQIHLSYYGWNDSWTTSAAISEDTDRGQISLVNWEPFDIDFHDIVAGKYDPMLGQRAREASQLPTPVFLDFAAEMNEEEGWGGHDPALYVAAYRHVHDVIAAADGGKIVWVWAPNNVDSDGAPAALDYYPGDEYVDWTGIDGYNWGNSDPSFDWQSVDSVFADVYDDLHSLGKPIIVGETASAEEGGSKADWIHSLVPTLRDRFPDIRAVVWFDVAKERDWRIRSSDTSATAFREIAADPLFQTPAR
jgi:hypothetical protein